MNEELQKRLAEAGVELIDWAREGGAFVKEQAPIVAQEVLRWVWWDSLIGILFYAGAVAVLVILVRKGLRSSVAIADCPTDESPRHFFSIIVGVLSFVVALVLTFSCLAPNIGQFVKVNVAPRVVLIEKLGSLFK